MLLAMALGCGGGADPARPDGGPPEPTVVEVPTPEGDPATIPLAGACALPVTFGTFTVEVQDYYSAIAGSAANAVVPSTVLEPVGSAGDCVLLRRNNPFCDPPCGADETCGLDETCVPRPLNQDLGTVTIGGLVTDVIMEPVPPGNTYFAADLPNPIFTPGALVELRTHGTTFGDEQVLHGVGFPPVDLGADRSWVLDRDEALVFSWVPAEGRSSIKLEINVDQHGLTPVTLTCELADDGDGEISAELLTQLLDLGVTGYPNVSVTRHTVDSAPLEGGCVQLEVLSEARPEASVEGYMPCNGPEDCPDGTCDLAVGLCV